MMELECYSRKRSISDGSGSLPAKMLCCRDEARIIRTSSASFYSLVSPRFALPSPRMLQAEANSSTIVVFVFSEMVQIIASFLGDIASVGRFLCTCKDVVSSPSAPGVWGVVADAMYGVQRDLPLSFNYVQYLREKIVWKHPISWEAVRIGTSPSGRSRAGVTTLDDKIIVVGGHTRHLGEFTRERDVWCYDTVSDTYSQVTTSENRGPPQISRLGMESFDGVAYAFGGILQDKTKINTISSFDLATKEWRTVEAKGVPPSARCDPITCAYQVSPEKKGLIVLGGSQEGLLYYSDVHFFNIVTNTWERVTIDNEGPSPRIGATATLLDHKMYVYGGAVWDPKTVTYTKHYGEMWCLHLGTGVWHWELLPNYGPSPTGTLVNLTMVPIGNHLLIEGIMGQHIGYLYDTVAYTWALVSAAGQSVNTSNFSSAVLVNSNIYYLCGYRDHVLAQDVIKLSIAHIQEFVQTGTLSLKTYSSTSTSDVEMEGEEDEEEAGL